MRSGSCPRQLRPPTEPSGSMWRAISTSLPIVAALILLPTIAFANPPDPSWIAGIYDGADGDDVVIFLYEIVAVSVAAARELIPVGCLLETRTERIRDGALGKQLTVAPRAPPASASTASDPLS